jgi:single-stranded-DNA-specific exonuclease
MAEDIWKLAKTAAEKILSNKPHTRFRLISHYDADGISAATIMTHALFREGYDVHTTLMRNPFTKGLERLKEEQNEFIIFTDLGSGQLPMIEPLKAEIIIIDHHQIQTTKTPHNIFQINANLCGINGNYEACGATLSYAVAKKLNENNTDLLTFALAGATGDKQYIGGFRGYNKQLLDEAIENKILTPSVGLKLSDEPLIDSLYYSVDPFYPGLSGQKDRIQVFLEQLSLDPNKSYKQLSNKEKEKLHSMLLLLLVEQGCELNILDTVIRERYESPLTHGELESFADLLDACGKGGHRDIGLALCIGDATAHTQAQEFEKTYKQQLLDELLLLEKNGVEETASFRYFYANHSSLGGVIGGILTNFMLDKEKPLLSIAKKPDELHISGRGNQYLVDKGLDLGAALQQAAKTFNGHGGGHKIAAGATVPASIEKEFIEQVDAIISSQLQPKEES